MGWSKGRITVLKRDAGLMLRKENTPGERGKEGKKEKSKIRKVHCGLFGRRLAFGRRNDRVEKPPTLQLQGAFFIGMYIPDIC